jgi:hypothetical protein
MAGLLSLRCFADPLEIQRLSVESARGEPLRALVSVRMLPDEQISPDCLSLGDETDLPHPDYPLLRDAVVRLSPAGDSIQITTRDPVDTPAVSVVLRIQCPGEALTARHFNLLIRHAWESRAADAAPGLPAYPTFTRLTLLHDETVTSIARAVHPHDPAARRELERTIIASNPELFPQGRRKPLRAGTRLLLPLTEAGKLSPPAAPAAGEPIVEPETVQESAKPERPRKLRLKLARGEPSVQRSAQWTDAQRAELRRLFRGETISVAGAGTQALELKIAQVREAQGMINSHLARLEQLVESLRRSIATLLNAPPVVVAPAPKPPPAPPPVTATPVPRPPAVQQLPPAAFGPGISWKMWAAAAGGAILLAIAAFLLGRRSKSAAVLAEHEARIDSLLHEARQAAGPLLTPTPVRQSPPMPMRPPEPPPQPRPRPFVPPPPEEAPPPLPEPAASDLSVPPLPDLNLDAGTSSPTSEVDVELEPAPEPQLPAAEPPTAEEPKVQLKQEMDMAIDNSRSMFTDVDRFIALGRIQNAISLLEFQTQRDPRDRDSWVKLMAVYRQEGMETEFQRAFTQFKRHFPEEV